MESSSHVLHSPALNPTAVRFCLPWLPNSVNFRRSDMAGRLTVLASFGTNQTYGGNQWLFVADVEHR